MIAGIMHIWNFPLDVFCLQDLLPRVQALVLRFDKPFMHRRPIFEQLLAEESSHLVYLSLMDAAEPWSPTRFREPMLRALDDWQPSIVLQPDSDETFGPGFERDLDAFTRSSFDMLFFNAEMPTKDNAWVPTQPKAAHCKVFRWRPGLSYDPYAGYGGPNGLNTRMVATSKLQHYCCYTPEIQQMMLKKQTMPADQRAYWGQRRPK